MREQLLQNKRSSPHLFNLMSQYIASQAQLELNLSLSKFLLAEKLKTNEVRQLIRLLAKQEFSAQRILYLIQEQKQLQIPYPQGWLTISASPQRKSGRFYLWDIATTPRNAA
jgi:hypothetical protein